MFDYFLPWSRKALTNSGKSLYVSAASSHLLAVKEETKKPS